MKDQAVESESNSPYYLEELKGDEIVDVEIVDGGSMYCRAIRITLKSGKHLRIDSQLDVGAYGIQPRIKYGIGAWFSSKLNQENEDETANEPTIEWYKAQVKELLDIRIAFHNICGDTANGADAYFPDLVAKELRKIKK